MSAHDAQWADGDKPDEYDEVSFLINQDPPGNSYLNYMGLEATASDECALAKAAFVHGIPYKIDMLEAETVMYDQLKDGNVGTEFYGVRLETGANRMPVMRGLKYYA